MRKIIKPGTKMIIECEACGCEFSYDCEDIEEDRDGEWVVCPQCGNNCLHHPTLKTAYSDGERETWIFK